MVARRAAKKVALRAVHWAPRWVAQTVDRLAAMMERSSAEQMVDCSAARRAARLVAQKAARRAALLVAHLEQPSVESMVAQTAAWWEPNSVVKMVDCLVDKTAA